jgi:hypothetical protein
LKKIWFFGIKSWFFTRNTPKIFAPPSARRYLFKCAPLTWNPGSAPVLLSEISLLPSNRNYLFISLNWSHRILTCPPYPPQIMYIHVNKYNYHCLIKTILCFIWFDLIFALLMNKKYYMYIQLAMFLYLYSYVYGLLRIIDIIIIPLIFSQFFIKLVNYVMQTKKYGNQYRN